MFCSTVFYKVSQLFFEKGLFTKLITTEHFRISATGLRSTLWWTQSVHKIRWEKMGLWLEEDGDVALQEKLGETQINSDYYYYIE